MLNDIGTIKRELRQYNLELEHIKNRTMCHLKAFEAYTLFNRIDFLIDKIKTFNQKLDKLNDIKVNNTKLNDFSMQ